MAKLVNPDDWARPRGNGDTPRLFTRAAASRLYSTGVAVRRGERVLAKRFIAAAIKRGPGYAGKDNDNFCQAVPLNCYRENRPSRASETLNRKLLGRLVTLRLEGKTVEVAYFHFTDNWCLEFWGNFSRRSNLTGIIYTTNFLNEGEI